MTVRIRLRRAVVWSATLVAVFVVLVGGAYELIEFNGNLHVVERGVLYRSAQLDRGQLADSIKALGIKTVLNLRGPNRGSAWYDDEVRVAQDGHVLHVDFALSAQHELTAAQMQEVIRIIDRSPKPVLVHCNGGSDRTGLVAALYELSRGQSAEAAGQQLSLRYGHFPYLGSATIAMDRSLERYSSQTAVPDEPNREKQPLSHVD